MIMRMAHDRGISIKYGSAFNYDGQHRDSISREEASEILNYRVEKAPLYFGEDKKTIRGMFGLVRTDVNEIVASHSVGTEFTVSAQPLDAFNWIYDNIVSNVGDMEIEDVVTMRNGGAAFFTFKVGGSFRVKGDSSEQFHSVLFSDNLGVSSLCLGTVFTRIVCMNTLARARKECAFKIAHTKNSGFLVQGALESIRAEIEAAKAVRSEIDFLASKDCTSAMYQSLLERTFPLGADLKSRGSLIAKGKRELAARQFEGDDSFGTKSMWTALNSITYFSSNPAKMNSRTDAAGVGFDNINGVRGDFNRRVFNDALAIAKAA